jgi:glycosyltransferase involved in cell wall biosynthesis
MNTNFIHTIQLVDIIIPTHNRPNLLAQALEALGTQVRRTSQTRVIAVNDGTHSTDYKESSPPTPIC